MIAGEASAVGASSALGGGGPFFRYRVVSLVPDAPSSEFLIGPMIIRYWTRLANRP